MPGDVAPGIPGGVFGTNLGIPEVTPDGKVVFRAVFEAPGGVAGYGYWMWNDGALVLLGLGGDPVGAGTATYAHSRVIPRSDGAVFTHLTVTNAPADRDTGFMLLTPGDDMPLVLEGDPAPGTNGAVFDDFPFDPNSRMYEVSHPSPNALAVLANVRGGDTSTINTSGVWIGRPGNLSLLFRSGDPAPGEPAGTTIFPEWIDINPSGEWVVRATLGRPDGAVTAVLLGSGHTITRRWVTGEPAAGTPGVVFNQLDIPVFISAAGQVTLYGESGDALALWSGFPDSLEAVARVGRPIYGTGCACFTINIYDRHTLGDSGVTAALVNFNPLGFAYVVHDAAGSAIAARRWMPVTGLPSSHQISSALVGSGYPRVGGGGHVTMNVQMRDEAQNAYTACLAWDRLSGLYPVLTNRQVIDLRGSPTPVLGMTSALTISDDGRIPFAIVRGFNDYAIVLASLHPTGPFCDSIDFNRDGLTPDTDDIGLMLSVFSGLPCPSVWDCNDIDFNNDGISPDTADIDAFLRVYSGGSCE